MVCFDSVRAGLILDANVITNNYGVSSLPIRLDDVTCLGIELNLDECIHDYWDNHNCDHDEDIGCICTPGNGSTVTAPVIPVVQTTTTSSTTERTVVVNAQTPITGTITGRPLSRVSFKECYKLHVNKLKL